MSEVIEKAELFELELELPNDKIAASTKRLVGFENRYQRLHRDFACLLIRKNCATGARNIITRNSPSARRYRTGIRSSFSPAMSAPERRLRPKVRATGWLARARKEAMLFKLSTRVRGSGKVGQMSTLLNEAFDVVAKQAGKTRQAFLIIDEADSLASTRDTAQSHHEDKVAVNTIIQKVDDLRRHSGRILVFLCTNRAGALDPAIVRRAARTEEFDRPNDQEREELFRMDLDGLNIKDQTIHELVRLTGRARRAARIYLLRPAFQASARCALPGISEPGADRRRPDSAAKEVRPSPVVRNG